MRGQIATNGACSAPKYVMWEGTPNSVYINTLLEWALKSTLWPDLRTLTITQMDLAGLRRLAVPSVCVLIACLSYGSQLIFYYLQPGPLSRGEAWLFNTIVAAIWFSYERACRVDPGRLPREVYKKDDLDIDQVPYQRWCKKCNAPKPVRSHHCKQCQR